MATDPRELAAPQRVGDGLAPEVDHEGAVDGDHLAVSGDELRRVHDVDGQEAHLLVAVEPLVEVGGARREGADRHALELALVGVRDLAGLVQLHEPGGEHLRVHAVVAAVVVGQEPGDGRGDAADAGLEGAPVGDEGPHVTSDLLVHLGGHRVGQDEHGPVALDDQVGVVVVEAVRMVRHDAEGPRGVGHDLGDHDPFGIGDGPVQLGDRRAGVDREAHPALLVGGGHRGGDDPGGDALQDGREAAEVGGDELDVGAGVEQEALGRAVEAAQQVDAGAGEQLVEVHQQRAEDDEVVEALTLAEGVEQAHGLAGAEGNPQAIGVADEVGALFGRVQREGHARSVADRFGRAQGRRSTRPATVAAAPPRTTTPSRRSAPLVAQGEAADGSGEQVGLDVGLADHP